MTLEACPRRRRPLGEWKAQPMQVETLFIFALPISLPGGIPAKT
jgi:hypothetical protein